MDLDALRGLLTLLKDHDVQSFRYEDDDAQYEIRFDGGDPPVVAQLAPPAPVAARVDPVSAPPDGAAAAVPTAPAGAEVTAPVVGTFYAAPTPGASPFVEVGQRVEQGQVLCIIEAMKLMNEIEAEKAGTIVACLVDDGTPVEFGQPIFRIRPG